MYAVVRHVDPLRKGQLKNLIPDGHRFIDHVHLKPAGFIGQLLRLVARYVPPTPGVQSPLLWGTDAHVRELFPGAMKIEHTTRMFAFRYRSPEHWVEVFRNFYGPTHMAFLALDATGQAALEADLVALLRSQDVGGGNGLVVPGEYLETVITK